MEKYNKDLQKTIDILKDKLEVADKVLSEYSKVNRELRSFNDDLTSKIRRLEKENAQCVRTMQMMLKIMNFCEKGLDNYINLRLEENHKVAELKEKEWWLINKVILSGNLVADPEIKQSGELTIAKYTLAVNRNFNRKEESGTDFIRCVAFNKQGEFAEKYLSKGKNIAVEGRIQTGSYENKKGEKVYTTDIIVNSHEFISSKKDDERVIPQAKPEPAPTDNDGFMEIPDNADDSGLPFNF